MDAETRERKLRLAKSAAGSAVANGCDPDEVRRQMEIGIAEAVAEINRPRGERLVPTPIPVSATSGTPALDAWAQAVNG